MSANRCMCAVWVGLVAMWPGQAAAAPPFLNAFEDHYPESTLPARMNDLTGSSCNVCHVPPSFDSIGNCYREDMTALLNTGIGIDEAILMLDGVDSDGDGAPNGFEATLPYADLPGEIGYNMGLVGELGTDPCGDDPMAPVSGVLETPPGAVPAASTLGMLVLAVLVTGAGALVIRRRTAPSRA